MTDSHGAGKWRGAPGVWWEVVNEGLDSVLIGGPCDGCHTQGQGQQGGCPTPINLGYIMRANEKIEITHPHKNALLKPGDVFTFKSGGGAGIGPPEERDPEAVRTDVKNELVSLKAAREIYKVVINPDTLEVDQVATRKLRAKR